MPFSALSRQAWAVQDGRHVSSAVAPNDITIRDALRLLVAGVTRGGCSKTGCEAGTGSQLQYYDSLAGSHRLEYCYGG